MADSTGFLKHERALPPRRPVDVRILDWKDVYLSRQNGEDAVFPVAAVRAAVPDLNHRTIIRSKRRDPRQGGSGQGHCQRSDHRRADQNDTSHTGIPPTAGSRCLA